MGHNRPRGGEHMLRARSECPGGRISDRWKFCSSFAKSVELMSPISLLVQLPYTPLTTNQEMQVEKALLDEAA